MLHLTSPKLLNRFALRRALKKRFSSTSYLFGFLFLSFRLKMGGNRCSSLPELFSTFGGWKSGFLVLLTLTQEGLLSDCRVGHGGGGLGLWNIFALWSSLPLIFVQPVERRASYLPGLLGRNVIQKEFLGPQMAFSSEIIYFFLKQRESKENTLPPRTRKRILPEQTQPTF